MPNRPLVAPTLALLSGALAGPLLPGGIGGALCSVGALVLGAVSLRLPGAGLVALVCLGATVDVHLATSAERRAAAALGRPGQVWEGDFVGRVCSAPVRLADGAFAMEIRGPVRPGGSALRVRLRVLDVPADRLRDFGSLTRGEQIGVFARLRRPRSLGNPTSRDPRLRLRARGLDAVGTVKSARLVHRLGTRQVRGLGRIDRIRARLRDRLEQTLSPSSARLLLGALLLGDRGQLPEEVRRDLREAGLAHLVAISGLHVGLGAMGLLFVLRRSGAGPGSITLAALPCLGLFALLVGGAVPVWRAALAASVPLAGRVFGREGDAWNTLALLALLFGLARPGVWHTAGFQLSFAAVAGILAAAHRGHGLVGVSTAAYLATAPLTAWHFGALAPAALLTNLLAVPLCAVCLGAGYLALATPSVPVLGTAGATLAREAAEGLLRLARAGAALPGGAWVLARPSLALVLAYAVLGAAALLARTPRSAGAARLGFFACLTLLHVGAPPRLPGAAEVAAIDVGQGQAVLLRGPGDDGALLVDAGGAYGSFDPGEREVVPYLAGLAVRHLDVLAISHGHLDHVGGAPAVLRNLEVGELWLHPGWHRDPALSRLAGRARQRGIAVVQVEAGTRFDRAGLSILALSPGRSDGGADPNESSLVLRVGDPPHRVLLAGDIGSRTEARLLRRGSSVRAEAALAPHHGSRHSSSGRFVRAVAPEIVVISCGRDNRFGHPARAVVERWRAAGARVLRTDRDGLVVLRASAGGWRRVRAGRP